MKQLRIFHQSGVEALFCFFRKKTESEERIQMNNYSIDTLIVEITRRCNLKCEHCIQGEAQNITITKKIIDKLFHQVDKVKEIRIAGGETLLEIETLEYMLQAIDLYGLETAAVSLITNGTIRDSRVIEVFDGFVKKKNNRYVSMLISDDNFHDIDQSKKTLRFYSSINSNNKILIKLFSDSGEPNVNNGAPLTYSGRAITYIEKNGFKDVSNIVIKENSIRTHQICVKENTIKCMLQLSANGGIGLTLYADYETSDKLSIGNIQQCSLKDIINNHNYNCPYLCDECYNETLNISAPIMFSVSIASARRISEIFKDKTRSLNAFSQTEIAVCEETPYFILFWKILRVA